VLNDLDQGAQVRQDGAAHENGDLLHDLDTSVTRLNSKSTIRNR